MTLSKYNYILKSHLQFNFFLFRSLIIYSIIEGKFNVLFTDPDFKSYSVMAVSDIIAIGNIRGVLRLIIGVSGHDTGTTCI